MKRKGIGRIEAMLIAGAVWTCSVMTVFAGDINANEQSVLNAAEGTFEHGGKTYVATQAAKDRIRNYLMQDGVDLTAEQAAKAISQAFGNVEQGIAQGYLVLADGQSEEPAPSPDGQPEESEESGSGQTDVSSGQDSHGTSGTGVSGSGSAGSAQGADMPGNGADGTAESALPEKMTKEEEEALIASILENEGLEAEEKTDDEDASTDDAESSEKGKKEKLPRGINVGRMAVAVAAIVLAAAGIILYRHRNRFRR